MSQNPSKRTLRVLGIALCLAVLLPPAPLAAHAPAAPVRQPAPGFQGEIAYVLDGNLWLHDLLSGATRQLTSDGNALAPAWSPDGSALLYSQGADLESADLYLRAVGVPVRAEALPA